MFYISKITDLPYDKAIEKTTDELKKEGFGILTEIDVKSTLKKKLDVDFRKYIILGACNPEFAYKALSEMDKIGLLLPCNVVVQQTEEGKVEVSTIDPVQMLSIVNKPELAIVAKQVKEKLERAINNI